MISLILRIILIGMTWVPLSGAYGQSLCKNLLLESTGFNRGFSYQDRLYEHALEFGEIIEVKANSEVTSGPTYFVKLKAPSNSPLSGQIIKGIFKSNATGKLGSYHAEISAYYFDRLFGFQVTPVTVARSITLPTGDGLVDGSLQLMAPIRKPWKDYSELEQVMNADPKVYQDFYKVRLFQFLIFDKDRNVNNARTTKSGRFVSIDHEQAFGMLDPFGESSPLSIKSFPKDVNFGEFADVYRKISQMSEREYADAIAPLVLQTAGLKASEPLTEAKVRTLNWTMGILMSARKDLIYEYKERIAGRGNNPWSNLRELNPYYYFEPTIKFNNSDKETKKKKLK